MLIDKSVKGTCIILVITVIFGTNAKCDSEVINVNSADYQIPHSQEWHKSNISKEQLNEMVRDVLGIQTYERTYIGEFVAKDLNDDGRNEIIASVNERCTSDSVMFVLLFRIGEAVQLQTFRTHWGNIPRDIADLDNDGTFEVIIKNVLAESTGHVTCVQ